jgi:hypothetical protein
MPADQDQWPPPHPANDAVMDRLADVALEVRARGGQLVYAAAEYIDACGASQLVKLGGERYLSGARLGGQHRDGVRSRRP